LKQALTATALSLGGVVPHHIAYSEARKSAVQNWLWSVGDNPMAYTSTQYHYSALHKDIAFRNYIVHTLNDTLYVINQGVSILLSRKTCILNNNS
jgi:hypothetical protein